MHPDPVAITLAATFTAGCMMIYAARYRANDVTLILTMIIIGLMNATSGVIAERTGPAMDPVVVAELISYQPRHD